MKKSKEFDSILNECLERVLVKGEPIKECLISYPQQADELKPLLQTAFAARQASAIQPHPEFRAKARYQFRLALQEVKSKGGHPLFSWQRWWVRAVTIVFILLLVGGGTVAAASNSMPGELLYPVKLATEQVWLTLTPSALSKAELYARLANRRVAEIVYVANKGDPEQVEQATQRLDTYLATIAVLAGAGEEAGGILRAPTQLPAPEKAMEADEGTSIETDSRATLRMTLAHYAVNHPAALQAGLKTAPESVKSALRRAIAVSVAGYERALAAVEGK